MARLSAFARLSFFAALVLAVLVASPRLAAASPAFPVVMLNGSWGLTQAPPCALCHAGDVRARDTVFTPFGRALRLNGLIARDEASLTRALDELDRNAVDSDYDGVSDVNELIWGTDPNRPPSFADAPPTWTIGCSAAGGPRPAAKGALAWLAVTGGILVGAWRRKRSRSAALRG